MCKEILLSAFPRMPMELGVLSTLGKTYQGVSSATLLFVYREFPVLEASVQTHEPS